MAKWYCRPCRKPTYSSFRVADKVRHRANRRNRIALDEGTVYWCAEAGGFHVTSMDRSEYDRQQADREARLSTDPRWITRILGG